MGVRIDDSQVNSLLAQLSTMLSDEQMARLLFYLGDRIGVLAENIARPYPPAKRLPLPLYYTLNGKPSKFKSEKQRRYVMAHIRDGSIRIPYAQTGMLGNSITHTTSIVGTSVEVTVGTNLAYAQYVIGPPGVQSAFMALKGWQPLEQKLAGNDDRFTNQLQGDLGTFIGNGLAFNP